MRLVLVDAYDSFTWNLAQALEGCGARVDVVRCDEVELRTLHEADRLVFGPGPGRPEQAGVFVDALRELVGVVPILGVCLGHQALAVALGGALVRWPPRHGYASRIDHDGTGLFAGVAPGAEMGRYHSLGVDEERLPDELRVVARAEGGEIMALAHRGAPAWGVQFHPESVMSGPDGERILANFVRQPG